MTTLERRLITLDVFTDHRYGGNPLAIVPDAAGLEDATMQRIAGELNLSETVFIRRAEDGIPVLRIFTPKSELPFAGHPTVGAAIHLAEEHALADGATLLMRVPAGDVTARIERGQGRQTVAEITSPRPPECRPAADVAACGAAIGLSPAELAHAPRICDAGNPFTVIPVASRNALSRAALDAAAWAAGPGSTEASKLFIVYMDDWLEGREIHARMFAPSIGIPEDPATGSAAVAVAGLLGEIQSLRDGEHRWTIHQGVDMGRPSKMAVRAVVRNGAIASAHVGGSAVRVITGSIRVD